MTFISAALACVTLAVLGAFHLYWALGGKMGKAAAIPSVNGKPLFMPGPGMTALVGIALFAMSGLVGAAAGAFTTPVASNVLKVATGLLALVFLARAIGDFRYVGFFKRIEGNVFAARDTYFYSPLCLALAVLIGLVAAG